MHVQREVESSDTNNIIVHQTGAKMSQYLAQASSLSNETVYCENRVVKSIPSR